MWARLRDRRRKLQDTPLVKGSTGRCDSVSAGLAQFEEQMTAARAVSTVTRPANLFYALEQAGLAIAAVHAQGEYWFSSHGLKVVDIDARLCDIKVRVDAKQTRGAYGIVSNAVGSQVIESEVSVGALWAFLNSLAPCYRYEGQRYLRPSIGRDGNKPPSPLMTWWLLLYVFSMISRYRPGQWNKLLDLDKSEYAAPITYALEEVFSVLPHLILEGLDNKPWLLRKPS
jgi:hypothetical protein